MEKIEFEIGNEEVMARYDYLLKKFQLTEYQALKIAVDMQRNQLLERAFIESHHEKVEPIHAIESSLSEIEEKLGDLIEILGHLTGKK